MTRRFKVWLNSGANIHSCNEITLNLKGLGMTEEQFNAMTEEEKDKMFLDIAFEQGEWGWEEIK